MKKGTFELPRFGARAIMDPVSNLVNVARTFLARNPNRSDSEPTTIRVISNSNSQSKCGRRSTTLHINRT